MKIVITGTPGTGKTTLAQELGKLLKMQVIDVNAVAKKTAVKKRQKIGKHVEVIVDLKKLHSALLRELKNKNNYIVEGHLACEVVLPVDVVVVLRCDPFALRRRLRSRRYPEKKIAENILAEALDYCLVKAEQNYGAGKVIQLNATRYITALRLAGVIRSRKSEKVNWKTALAKFAAQHL